MLSALRDTLIAWLLQSPRAQAWMQERLTASMDPLLRAAAAQAAEVVAANIPQPTTPETPPAPMATLAPTARLMPEAVVANASGGPETIRLGDHTVVRGRLFTYGHGGDIALGDWCYVGERSEIWSMESIRIGHRVLIAHDVNIHDGTAHSLDPTERHAHYQAILDTGHPRDGLPGVQSAPIVIEDDAWISFGCTILKGVTIGKGAVIAAKSIVTKDVPPHTIYRNEVIPYMRPLHGDNA